MFTQRYSWNIGVKHQSINQLINQWILLDCKAWIKYNIMGCFNPEDSLYFDLFFSSFWRFLHILKSHRSNPFFCQAIFLFHNRYILQSLILLIHSSLNSTIHENALERKILILMNNSSQILLAPVHFHDENYLN